MTKLYYEKDAAPSAIELSPHQEALLDLAVMKDIIRLMSKPGPRAKQ